MNSVSWFCIGLVLIYGLLSFPDVLQVSDIQLSVWSLDLKAIFQHQQYWRLLTANLVHADIMHLSNNLFALWIFGTLLHRMIGSASTLLWMLFAMIGCNALTIWAGLSGSVGASGIAYGLEAGFITLMLRIEWRMKQKNIGQIIRAILGYGLLMWVLNATAPHYINTWGHWGGAIAGVLCALVYPLPTPNKNAQHVEPVE